MTSPFAKIKLTKGDLLLFLHPYDPKAGVRTGIHPGKSFTGHGVTDYSAGTFFQAEGIRVQGPRDMHNALTSAAHDGKTFVCRAAVAHKGRFIRRSKNRIGNCPPGLATVRLQWAAWDCDKWPNQWVLDPRTQGQELIARLRETLGPEFVQARGSLQWSSSCCVGVPIGQAPTKLSFRIWSWCASAMEETALRDIAKRLDARVRQTLNAPHHVGFLVDPKVADIQQPIYLANPRFEDVPDPMDGHRWVWLDGTQECLTIFAEDMPPPTAKTAWTRPQGQHSVCVKEKRQPAAPKPRSTTVHVPGQPIPMAAAAREIAAAREVLATRGMESFRTKCNGFGLCRATLEMVALAIYRGGLQPGDRNESATMIASGVVASLEPDGRSDDRVRAEVRAVLRLCVPDAWISLEWEGKADATIISKFRAASVLAAAKKLSCHTETRYTYGLPRLRVDWAASREEVVALGLRSIAAHKDRVSVERQADGIVCRDAYLNMARQDAPRVAELVAAGMGLRAIARATGLPVSKVRRLMALTPEQVAAVTQTDVVGRSVRGETAKDGKTYARDRMVA